MPTPIEQAETLRNVLGRIAAEIPMAAKWRISVEQMVQQCGEMIAKLQHIHSEIVPLELRNANVQHGRSFELFKALPGGTIERGHPEFDALCKQSATLRELYRAGFEIPAMVKFSDEELGFAKEIGEGFHDWNDAWRGYMLSSQHGETYRQPKNIGATTWDNFLTLLKRRSVITDYAISSKDYQKNVFVPSSIKKIKYLHQNNLIRFDWTKGDPRFDPLIGGHWFSAFAYSIIVDHLDRLGSDFETYTLVRYSAPRDVIRSSGDFDVIARTGDKILMIECKSGSLKGAGDRSDLPMIVEKAEALRRVFVHANSEIVDYSFWLVYNPYLNRPEDILSALDGSGITAVRPEDIRGEVRRCFDSSLRVAAP